MWTSNMANHKSQQFTTKFSIRTSLRSENAIFFLLCDCKHRNFSQSNKMYGYIGHSGIHYVWSLECTANYCVCFVKKGKKAHISNSWRAATSYISFMWFAFHLKEFVKCIHFGHAIHIRRMFLECSSVCIEQKCLNEMYQPNVYCPEIQPAKLFSCVLFI